MFRGTLYLSDSREGMLVANDHLSLVAAGRNPPTPSAVVPEHVPSTGSINHALESQSLKLSQDLLTKKF